MIARACLEFPDFHERNALRNTCNSIFVLVGNCGGTVRDGLADKGMAVGLAALDRDEQRSCGNLPGVAADVGNLDAKVAPGIDCSAVLYDILKSHSTSML
jgi:hypothetical protein